VRVDGSPYENTIDCWVEICHATRDALLLGLVPPDAFVDNRTDDPVIHLVSPDDASIGIGGGQPFLTDTQMPELPTLALDRPVVPQPYHIEIWSEKSTMNDILVPLAEMFKLNLITGAGEMSTTVCIDLVDRAEQSDRPVRILYVSDFDPGGLSMPLAVARKIEFELQRRCVDLDIQVRPIVLSHEQCAEYRLPRIPIKVTEKRATKFEERFGEGATELDALEALHPGLLRQILEREIGRYWNEDHDDGVDDACQSIEDDLEEITADAHSEHQDEIDALAAEWQEIVKAQRAWIELAKPVWQAIREKLEVAAPRVYDTQWRPDFDADEDPDPMFDSTRDYVEQMDRYKEHQGKPTEKVVWQRICIGCGKPFEAKRSDKKICSKRCYNRTTYLRSKTSAGSLANDPKC
jgi:hypothetical protein